MGTEGNVRFRLLLVSSENPSTLRRIALILTGKRRLDNTKIGMPSCGWQIEFGKALRPEGSAVHLSKVTRHYRDRSSNMLIASAARALARNGMNAGEFAQSNSLAINRSSTTPSLSLIHSIVPLAIYQESTMWLRHSHRRQLRRLDR